MSSYSTLLKTWGDTGSEFPDGYSYLEGEQPVDAWDNFLISNVIGDLDSLIDLTNDRIETDKGASGSEPGSPEASHLYHDTDNEALSLWDAAAASWHRLLAADGDSLEGALDFAGYAAQNIGALSMSGDADLSGNDLIDGATTIYDAVNGNVPLTALEQDSVTITAGSHLSGGGTPALGGSVTLDVEDDFVLNSGDTMTGGLTVDGDHFRTPLYATKGDIGSIPEGSIVYVDDENAFYFEDGT